VDGEIVEAGGPPGDGKSATGIGERQRVGVELIRDRRLERLVAVLLTEIGNASEPSMTSARSVRPMRTDSIATSSAGRSVAEITRNSSGPYRP